MFVAYRQFASASGTDELKEVPVRLPSGAEIALDGTEVYPGKVWTFGAEASELLVLPGYFASINGDVWSRNQGGTLKKISPNTNLQVFLCVDGKRPGFLVHRIVASTFLSSIRHARREGVGFRAVKDGKRRQNEHVKTLRPLRPLSPTAPDLKTPAQNPGV